MFTRFWQVLVIRGNINWVDIVMVGDLLLSWEISSDMSITSDSDRDPSWNASWDKSLECWSSNCCLCVSNFVMFDMVFCKTLGKSMPDFISCIVISYNSIYDVVEVLLYYIPCCEDVF